MTITNPISLDPFPAHTRRVRMDTGGVFVVRRCKVMDMRLGELAPRHLETKFLRIDAEKAPFFVQKLQVLLSVDKNSTDCLWMCVVL